MARKKKGIKSKQRSRLKEYSKLKEKQRTILASNTQQSRPGSSSPEANIVPSYVDETTSLITRSTETPVPEESVCEPSNNGEPSIAISNLRTLVAPIKPPGSSHSNDTVTTTYASIGKPANLFGSSSTLENNNKGQHKAVGTLRFVSNTVCMNSTLALAAMDTSLMLTLFGLLSEEFEQLPQGSWMISTCLLSSAISYPLYRKLRTVVGDLFLLQLSLFALSLGSLASCLAPNFAVFLLGRSIFGVGLGSSLLIPFTTFESQQFKGRAQVRKIAPCIAIIFGTITGALSAGLLTELTRYRWRSAFMAEACIALGFIPCVQYFLTSSSISSSWREDLKTIRWSKFNAYAFILLLANAPTIFETRKASGLMVLVISSATLLGVAYVFARIWVQYMGKPRREEIFITTDNRCAATRSLLASMAIASTFAYTSLYLSVVARLSAMQIALRIIPGMLNIVVGIIMVDKLPKTFRTDVIGYTGGFIAFFGTLWLVFLPHELGTIAQFSLCVLPAFGLTVLLVTTARASNSAAKVSPLVLTAGVSLGVCWAGLLFHSVLWKQLVKQLSIFEETGIAREVLEKYAMKAYYSSNWAFNESPLPVRSAFLKSYINSCKSVSILTLACIALATIL